MKKRAVYTLILILIFIASAHAQRALKKISDLDHNTGKAGSYYAVLIGINDYKDPDISDLDSPVNDVNELGRVLEEQYNFKTEKLLNRSATWRNIYRKLRETASNADENDSILIYYAGHGDIDRSFGGGWWVPSDAEAGDPRTYLDNAQVQKIVAGTKAKHVLLISDSCYAGTLFGKSRSLPSIRDSRYYLSLFNEKSRWGMTSGNKTPVADAGADNHSIFAYQLIKAFKNTSSKYMTAMELHTKIAHVVGNNSEQTPMCRPIRNTGDMGGEFVFIASKGKDIPVPVKSAKKEVTEMQKPGGDTFFAAFEEKIQEKEKWKKYQNEMNNVFLKAEKYAEKLESEDKINMWKSFLVKYSKDNPYSYEDDELRKKAENYTISNFTNFLGMEFVYIKPGTFMMGSPSSEKDRDNDEKQQKVTLTKGYYIQTTEVTQGQWKKIMGNNPSRFKNCGDACPVEKVSWNDVKSFINKLNSGDNEFKYRLPTEAEWEYAARAGTSTPFYTGNCLSADQANYAGNYPYSGCSKGVYRDKTMSVGSFSPNSFGLYDMHGNVWEWCEDWEADYPSGHVTDPAGPGSGSSRVIRGGSWYNCARHCRSAVRSDYSPDSSNDSIGFRLVVSRDGR